MIPDDFRAAALALPEAVEGFHQGHADFRMRGKVFATLGYPDATVGMVKLTREQQEMLCAAEPAMFMPVKGGWGLKGATHVQLAAVDAASLASALMMAWRNVVPKGLVLV